MYSMQAKTEMNKTGMGPEGWSKKRQEVGNESPLTSIRQKQQTVTDLNNAQETYNLVHYFKREKRWD
jgi:hypothetical protein